MKLGELKRIIAEEARKHLDERTLGVSDSLNHLIGFAEVFANLPRRIRLDVLRVVEYEHERVDPENISKALDVLHGLDIELDAALEAYVDEYSGEGMALEHRAPRSGMRDYEGVESRYDYRMRMAQLHRDAGNEDRAQWWERGAERVMKGIDLASRQAREKKPVDLDEVAPPGWEGTVKAMKKHKSIKNPWALANSMKKKGYKSHKK